MFLLGGGWNKLAFGLAQFYKSKTTLFCSYYVTKTESVNQWALDVVVVGFGYNAGHFQVVMLS